MIVEQRAYPSRHTILCFTGKETQRHLYSGPLHRPSYLQAMYSQSIHVALIARKLTAASVTLRTPT